MLGLPVCGVVNPLDPAGVTPVSPVGFSTFGGARVPSVTSTIDVREADELLRLLPQKYVRPAQRRAAKRAVNSTKQLAFDTIREQVNISERYLRQRELIRTVESPEATGTSLVVRGEGVPLEAFSGGRQTRRGFSVEVLKSKGRQVIRSAFTFPGRGGPIIVERARKGGRRVGRGPVERLFGVAPAVTLGKPATLEKLRAHFGERFTIEVVRDLKAQLLGLTKRKRTV